MPANIKRFFVSFEEAGILCLFATLIGKKGDIFFPKENEDLRLVELTTIAQNFIERNGLSPKFYFSENEARNHFKSDERTDTWPCFVSPSNTTGEKAFEEFFTQDEKVDMDSFTDIGIVKYDYTSSKERLAEFENQINDIKKRNVWDKEELVKIFQAILPELKHIELNRSLDSKM